MYAVSQHMCHRSSHSDRELHGGLGCLLNPGFVVKGYKRFCVKTIEV